MLHQCQKLCVQSLCAFLLSQHMFLWSSSLHMGIIHRVPHTHAHKLCGVPDLARSQTIFRICHKSQVCSNDSWLSFKCACKLLINLNLLLHFGQSKDKVCWQRSHFINYQNAWVCLTDFHLPPKSKVIFNLWNSHFDNFGQIQINTDYAWRYFEIYTLKTNESFKYVICNCAYLHNNNRYKLYLV